MTIFANLSHWIIGFILILSSLGIIVLKKPVHASLSFLLTLLMLAVLYLELSAPFISVMQILVYAGAILVIFMYVIILFQDAHGHIADFKAKSSPVLLIAACSTFLLALILIGRRIIGLTHLNSEVPKDFGTVQAIGRALYIDFFFPFEAVVLLFLIALIGALYMAKKEN